LPSRIKLPRRFTEESQTEIERLREEERKLLSDKRRSITLHSIQSLSYELGSSQFNPIIEGDIFSLALPRRNPAASDSSPPSSPTFPSPLIPSLQPTPKEEPWDQ